MLLVNQQLIQFDNVRKINIILRLSREELKRREHPQCSYAVRSLYSEMHREASKNSIWQSRNYEISNAWIFICLCVHTLMKNIVVTVLIKAHKTDNFIQVCFLILFY